MTFNPTDYLTEIKGKSYLEVKWRLVWFREEHPDYTINTKFIELDMDKGYVVCKAEIQNTENRLLSTGTKTEYRSNFYDFIEKAETGAIGRALAALGYGTQFAPELEEGDRVVDSPVDFNQTIPDDPQEIEIQFGKYQGQQLKNIDTNYLEWLAENANQKYLRQAATNVITKRKSKK